jgi:hypothetical protein
MSVITNMQAPPLARASKFIAPRAISAARLSSYVCVAALMVACSSATPAESSVTHGSAAGAPTAAGGSPQTVFPGGSDGGTFQLQVTPASSGGMDTAAGAGGGNGAVQCNGRFTGLLRDFAVAQDPSGKPLDATTTPAIAEAIAGVNYASSPDFEVASAALHPMSAMGKRFVADLGMVQTALGADNTPVYAGPAQGTMTTTGPENFATWFHDTPGVNMSQSLSLQFLPNPANPSDPNAYYYDSSLMG